jgi:hypothetical protein
MNFNWDFLKPLLSGWTTNLLAAAGLHLGLTGTDEQKFIGAGLVMASFVWEWWKAKGAGEFMALLKRVTQQVSAKAAVAVAKEAPAPSVTATVAKVLIAAFVLSFLLAGNQAQAQVRRQAVAPVASSDPATDIANFFKRFTIAPAPATVDEIQNTKCDFTIFSKLTIDNAVPLLEKCAQSTEQGAVAPLVSDTQTALNNARSFGCPTPLPANTTCPGNGMAIACLVPALALLQAAQGTPSVKDPTTGKVTQDAVAAGVVTLGERLDEFVQAGGPSNCKTVIQRTVNGLAAAAVVP